MGDIDIESEIVRGLGSLRYTLYGLLRIANLRKYKARIWYKKAETEIYSEAKSVSDSDADAERDSNKTENSDEERSEINFTKQEVIESEVDDHDDKNNEEKVEGI